VATIGEKGHAEMLSYPPLGLTRFRDDAGPPAPADRPPTACGTPDGETRAVSAGIAAMETIKEASGRCQCRAAHAAATAHKRQDASAELLL
jgi:hypothetical protein